MQIQTIGLASKRDESQIFQPPNSGIRIDITSKIKGATIETSAISDQNNVQKRVSETPIGFSGNQAYGSTALRESGTLKNLADSQHFVSLNSEDRNQTSNQELTKDGNLIAPGDLEKATGRDSFNEVEPFEPLESRHSRLIVLKSEASTEKLDLKIPQVE